MIILYGIFEWISYIEENGEFGVENQENIFGKSVKLEKI